ncbi:hypothetical protein BDQ17DRAFT_1437145 [Cyathus striatus]|nr:hypothetical protein BDQ17DRAFT_1437145 [Cyathus striatus]
MGKPWAEGCQKEFLLSHYPQFHSAKANSKVPTHELFFQQFYVDWFNEFSLPNPTAQEITDTEGDSNLLLSIQENNMKWLSDWYYNKSRGTSVGRNGGKSHKCQNAYSKLYGETKILPKYEALRNEDSALQSDMAVPNKSIKDWNLLAEETEAVKMEVDIYHRQKKAGMDQNDGDVRKKNENYSLAIGVLKNTLPSIAESLSAQTGWQVSIFVGGPNPQFPDGECSILDYHIRKTLQGKDFASFLGNKHAELKKSFTQFIHHSYMAKECKSCVLLSVASDFLEESDSEDDSEVGDKDRDSSNGGDVLSNSDKESSPKDVPPSSDIGSSSKHVQSDKTVRQPKMSQYDINRKRNILEIKEKFRADDLEEGNHMKKKKAIVRRPKPKPINPIVPRRSFRHGTEAPGVSNVAEQSAPAASTEPPVSATITELPASLATTESLISQDTVTESPASLAIAKPPASPGIFRPSGSPNIAETPASPDITESLASPDPASPAISESPSSLDVALSPASPAVAKSPASPDIEPLVLTATEHRTIQLDTSKELMAQYAKVLLPHVDSVSDDLKWNRLIQAWVAFEVHMPSSSLTQPTKGLDQERKSPTYLPEVDSKLFGLEMVNWWRAIQPEWQKPKDTDTLYRSTPEDYTWMDMEFGGSTGLCMVIMAMSWWLQAGFSDKNNSDSFWILVEDITWSFNQICNALQLLTLKCKERSDATNQNPSDEIEWWSSKR